MDAEEFIHVLLDRIVEQSARARAMEEQRREAINQAANLREESAAKDKDIAALRQELDQCQAKLEDDADAHSAEGAAIVGLQRERDRLSQAHAKCTGQLAGLRHFVRTEFGWPAVIAGCLVRASKGLTQEDHIRNAASIYEALSGTPIDNALEQVRRWVAEHEEDTDE